MELAMSNNFNAVVFAERFENGGFTDAQAKALASALWELVDSHLATKSDLAALEARLTAAIAGCRAEFTMAINASRGEFTTAINAFKVEVTMAIIASRAESKADLADVKTDLAHVKAELLEKINEVHLNLLKL